MPILKLIFLRNYNPDSFQHVVSQKTYIAQKTQIISTSICALLQNFQNLKFSIVILILPNLRI